MPDKLWPDAGLWAFLGGRGRTAGGAGRWRVDLSVQGDTSSVDKLPFELSINEWHARPSSLLLSEYYATGEFVARAFAVGKTIKRQN